MDLPSFLWLWKAAAWSMGCSLLAFVCLGGSGGYLLYRRHQQQALLPVLRTAHILTGLCLVALVLLLLGIGIVGTLGHYGSLGHSFHGLAGISVVVLTLLSATSAFQIRRGHPKARSLHLTLNAFLGVSLLWVLATGWTVVQKYLP